MSDLLSEANLHEQVRNDAVAPLWRLPMEQKEFSSWSGNFSADPNQASADKFSSYSQSETTTTVADLHQQDADIFDVAYKKGWEDGQAAMNDEQAGNNAAVDQLSAAIGKLDDLHSSGSYEFILKAIETLFRRCAELAIPDEKLLQAWATQLADTVDQDQKSATLVLHPDDVALIDPEFCKIALSADENMLRGNLKLSHSGGWIEKGSEVALDELRALIDEFAAEGRGADHE
jgi:flagellar assembly protein FliH